MEQALQLTMGGQINLTVPIKARVDYLSEEDVKPRTKRLSGLYYVGGFVCPSDYWEFDFCPDFNEDVSHICLLDHANLAAWQNIMQPFTTVYPPPGIRYFVTVAGLKYAMGKMEKLVITFGRNVEL